MAGSRRVVIEFLGNDKTFGRTADRMGSKSDKLSQRMRQVGKVGALALAAGTVLAGKALVDMTRNAIEDDAAQRKLARALKNTTGATDSQIASVENWISKQGRVLGVTDDELRPAFQRLVQATGDVDEAQRQMSIAMDVSAGSGKSLKTVSEAMMKANNGSTAALSKLGLKTKKANGETMTLDESLKSMADTFGGQASEKANTLEGKMGRLRIVMDEAKETIGSKLIPVVTRFADWFLNKGIPAISAFSTEVRAKLGPVIEWVRGLFGKNTDGMASDVSKNLGAIKSTFQSVVSIVQSLWNQFGSTILSHAKSTFQNLRTIIGGALQVIAGVFKVFSSLLKGDWRGVWEGIKQILRGAWAVIKGIVAQGWNTIKTAFRIAGIAIKGIFVGIWNGLRGAAAAGINRLVGLIRGVPGRLRSLGGVFKSAGTSLIRSFVNGLSNAGSFISNIAGHIKDAVRGAINAGIDKINSALKIHIDWPGPGSFKWQARIPHLATGGVVKARPGGTMALLGEAGADEAVIPLSGPHAPKFGGGGGITIVVNGALDPAAVAEQIRQMLLKLKRTNGQELGIA